MQDIISTQKNPELMPNSFSALYRFTIGFIQCGGVQKLSGAVFCTRSAAWPEISIFDICMEKMLQSGKFKNTVHKKSIGAKHK